jgi:hypothetical protein
MKRWLLTIEGNNYQPKIYAESAEQATNFFKNENVIKVEPYTDTSFMAAISEMKSKSELLAVQNLSDIRTRQWYIYVLPDGVLRFRLYKDLRDNTYYDIAEYQFMSNDSLIYPCTFTYSNPAEVYSLFFTMPLFCEVASYRFYGQPKLAKPAELKGVKQSFSADYIPKKCACPCFVNGDDLWIKHRDFFSESFRPPVEDMGAPLGYILEKYFPDLKRHTKDFIYADAWGDVVLRNEAWIVFRNFGQVIQRDRHQPIQSLIKSFLKADIIRKSNIDSLSNDWYRFFENVIQKYNEFIKKGNG